MAKITVRGFINSISSSIYRIEDGEYKFVSKLTPDSKEAVGEGCEVLDESMLFGSTRYYVDGKEFSFPDEQKTLVDGELKEPSINLPVLMDGKGSTMAKGTMLELLVDSADLGFPQDSNILKVRDNLFKFRVLSKPAITMDSILAGLA